jgi:hypothetical protein
VWQGQPSRNSTVRDGLTVSPDEKTIIYTQFDRADSDLFLVENFK